MADGVRNVSVRGGSAGVEANAVELVALARFYGTAAREFERDSIELHRFLLDRAVVSAAALDPLGAARFTRSLCHALDGSSGLNRAALECTGVDLRLRATATAYVAADRLHTDVITPALGVVHVADAVGGFGRGLGSGGLGRAFSELAAADPQLADSAVDVLSSFWQDALLLGWVAALPDGRADVTRLGGDDAAAVSAPPRTVRDLMGGLAWRNRSRTGGDVDVRFVHVTDANGAAVRRVIVDVPGTKNWTLSSTNPDPTNLQTNLKAVTGARTTYEAGVLEAMRQAGVRPEEQVLVIGHSQGGMVALNLAEQTALSGEFSVTNVITAGSPIARLRAPARTQVLALENDGDVVPHADGAGNPDHVNETTVTIHRRTDDAVVNHDLEGTYVPGAGDVDASTDPSVRTCLQSLRPFLAGESVETEVFHVTRR